jgi:lauroyl/myristoyl acyltransferase
MTRLSHRLEYLMLRVLRVPLAYLPWGMAMGLAEGFADVLHLGLGWRREETRRRIRQVMPALPMGGERRVARDAMRNLARNVVDLLRANRMSADFVARYVDNRSTLEAIHAARGGGKGVLLVITHCGNWDLAGVLSVRAGIPMTFIARRQKNPLTYGFLQRMREQTGGTVIDRDDPQLIRKMLAALAQNQTVAILIDLRARVGGETFRYLGHRAWLANGLGLLAAKSGAEVLPVAIWREGRERHVWRALAPRHLEPTARGPAERAALLQGCLDELGAMVLAHPESYFWFNKRWVLEPHGEAQTPSVT